MAATEIEPAMAPSGSEAPRELVPPVGSLERFNEELRTLSRPLVDHLEAIAMEIEAQEQEIIRHQQEIKALRASRNKIAHVLRRLDPSLIPEHIRVPGGGPGPSPRPALKSHHSGPGVSPQILERFTEWLQEHREELNADGGFSPTTLWRTHERTMRDMQLVGDSRVAKALSILREQQILNLDRWVRGRPQPDQPTGKFYKVV